MRLDKISISAVVLTHNEEVNLPLCLHSLDDLCEKIFVVDSESADRTSAIAEQAGAVVVQHRFETHSKQWDWALHTLPLPSDWVLALDADQRISPMLVQNIRDLFSEGDPPVDGLYFCRRQIFQGRWIRYGGYYPKYLLKLFRRSKVIIDPNDLMEHHFYIEGPTAKLKGDLIEENQKEWDLSAWAEKHIRYAKLAAEEEWNRRTQRCPWPVKPNPWGTPDQKSLWAKRLWVHLPLYLRAFLYFGYRYFLLLGFLDGREGLRFHLLQGLWYRLLVDAELDARFQKIQIKKDAPSHNQEQVHGKF